MDTFTTSSSYADDSRQADAIEAGSILISLANSHTPDNQQEVKHHRASPPTAPHSNDHEHYRRPMSIHNLLSDDRSTQPDSPPLRPMASVHSLHRRRSSIEDQKAPVQYHSSPPIAYKRSLESEDHAMSIKRSSITRETRDYTMPPRYSSDYDRHTGNPALPNGKPMYRDTVDDPYRSRKDHKLNNADAYRYDHMSNNSQQRQQPPSHHHSSIHHSRKTSISSSLPQKYYAMKQSPNVKRNATHAYISYTIFMDITRRASIKHQLANDDPAAPYERPYHTQPYSPTPKFDRPTMYYNAPPRKQSQQYSRPNHHAPSERRRSSMSYSHYPPHESSSQPPSRYRPADMYQPPPQQQLMTQPLTAYLRDRNTGVPR